MGFNRVSVIENSVKQEGQQWGADHGLEIDAFNIEQLNIHKIIFASVWRRCNGWCDRDPTSTSAYA